MSKIIVLNTEEMRLRYPCKKAGIGSCHALVDQVKCSGYATLFHCPTNRPICHDCKLKADVRPSRITFMPEYGQGE